MKNLLLALSLVLLLPATRAGIVTREVTYPAGSVTAHAFLAAPAGKARHPGVLVVHEVWGLNDYARSRAKMLAEAGYVALAVDMYGNGKSFTHPKDAMALMNVVKSDAAEEKRRFAAAMVFLQAQPEVRPHQIAAIGYCFGGGVVLQMAADGVTGLDAVASFHGSLGFDVPPGARPAASVLVCAGDKDAFAPPPVVAAFRQKLDASGVHYTFVSYPDAMHSFTNPDADLIAKETGLPIGYNAAADHKSWAELLRFLKEVFPDQNASAGSHVRTNSAS